MCKIHVRRVWRYERGNQNPYIVQWPKEKVQSDIQRSTKHTHKTKDRVTAGCISLIDFALDQTKLFANSKTMHKNIA
jgi:hypothetical protein